MIRWIALLCAVLPALSFAANQKVVESFPGKVTVTVDAWGGGNKADLLFVVDSSGSMDFYQQELAKAAPAMLTGLTGRGWDLHFGVITTNDDSDPSHGIMPLPWITSATPSFLAGAARMMQVGRNGSATEMPFSNILAALTPPLVDMGKNQGFLRPDAKLAIVLITDGEDQSKVDSTILGLELQRLKSGDTSKIGVVAAIATKDNGCPMDGDSTEPSKIIRFVEFLKGSTVAICDPAMGENVSQALHQQLGSTVQWDFVRRIVLPSDAVADSIRVTYGSLNLQQGPRGWTYDQANKTVVISDYFDFTFLPEGTQLVIDYKPVDWL